MLRKSAAVLALALALPTTVPAQAREIVDRLLLAAVQDATETAEAPMPVLRSHVNVTGPLVRIGDLFDHAGRHADVAVFRAPDPGETGSVTTAQVIDAVRARDLFLFDTKDVTEVTVARAGRAVGPKEILAQVAKALAGQHGLGTADNLSITADIALGTVHVDAGAIGELRVARIAYDPRTTRYFALIDVPSGTKAAQLRLTGTAVETATVAVIKRNLSRGDLIGEADVAIERRTKSDIGADAIIVKDKAVGLAALRNLRAGQSLNNADLVKPDIVQRNEEVTLIYQAPGILLSARGKALESGALGSMVSILNEQSKRTVIGRITAPGQVTVVSQAPRLAANTLNSPNTPAAGVRRPQ